MGQKYLMAVDAGTGSVRAVLFDTEGNQIGVSQQEWFHREDPRWPGSMDFDWVHNWELASGCIRDVLAETGYEGYVLVEAEQDPAIANPFEYALKARKYIAEKAGL